MIRAAVTAGLLALLPGVAQSQALSCRIPAQLPVPRPDGPSVREPRRVLPIGGYTLALTWGPQYCRENARDGGAGFQCGSGNRFGFTLHGLWPDGVGKQWPQYCAPAAILPPATIARNLCATPSAQLLQHEYAKHGTCMGVTPAQYFARSTALFAKLRSPDMAALSRRRGLTAGQVAAAYARVNPGLTPAMIRVTAGRGGWLDELWLCLDTRLAYARCAPNQDGGLATSAPVKIWRGAR